MNKHSKIIMPAVLMTLTAFAACSLTACQSRPQLKQVASDAPEKPINSPEAAEQLKKNYGK